MRLLSNYAGKWYKKTTIAEALLDLFLTEIIDARQDSKLFIVSPWIRNIEFQTSVRGSLRTALSYMPSRISLLELLEEFIRRGGKVTIVCLPPHRLIYQEDIDSLIQLKLLEEKVGDYESKLMISTQITRTTTSILANKPMIDLLATLKKRYSKNVEIVYNERLHAKIYLGKYIAIVGSANITNTGFQFSDELCIMDNSKQFIMAVRNFCTSIMNRGFSERCEDYVLDKYLSIPKELGEFHPEVEKLIGTIRQYLSSRERRETGFIFNTAWRE